MMSEKDEESKKRQSMFEAKLREMETSRANLTTSGGGPLKNEKMMMMSRNSWSMSVMLHLLLYNVCCTGNMFFSIKMGKPFESTHLTILLVKHSCN